MWLFIIPTTLSYLLTLNLQSSCPPELGNENEDVDLDDGEYIPDGENEDDENFIQIDPRFAELPRRERALTVMSDNHLRNCIDTTIPVSLA